MTFRIPTTNVSEIRKRFIKLHFISLAGSSTGKRLSCDDPRQPWHAGDVGKNRHSRLYLPNDADRAFKCSRYAFVTCTFGLVTHREYHAADRDVTSRDFLGSGSKHPSLSLSVIE